MKLSSGTAEPWKNITFRISHLLIFQKEIKKKKETLMHKGSRKACCLVQKRTFGALGSIENAIFEIFEGFEKGRIFNEFEVYHNFEKTWHFGGLSGTPGFYGFHRGATGVHRCATGVPTGVFGQGWRSMLEGLGRNSVSVWNIYNNI